MDSKKIAYGLVTLSLILIISGGFSSFLIGLKEDRITTLKRVDEVKDEYEVFSANTSVFEAYREQLYGEVLSNTYYDTMFITDSDVKNKLSNYENLVDELVKNTRKMDSLCNDVYYPNSDTNNKCSSYRGIYEQVVNYFVSDINSYNKNIDKFNEYQKSLGAPLTLKYYDTKKTFIDYNNDKAFDGKEE